MSYKFVANLSENDYNDFLKTKSFTSYKQESNWSKLNNVIEILYVGATYRKKLIAGAKIEICKMKNDFYFYIPGGLIHDNNEKLLIFLNENIKSLAKIKNAYYIKIDMISEKENLELRNIGYKLNNKINHYSIIDLKANNKFLTPKFFEKSLNLPDIKRSGIFFEVLTNKKQMKELFETFDYWRYQPQYDYEQLLKIYKSKVLILTEKIDLVFYLNTLRDNCAKESDIVMAEELIKVCGDELILGFAVLILSTNKENIFCIEMYDNGAFPQLNITNQLHFEIIKSSLSKKYQYIFFIDNINYKYTEFEYHLAINKWKYLKHKIIK